MHKPPRNLAEFQKRFTRNNAFEGVGLDTKAVLPCPACAAERWAVIPILAIESELSRERGCSACGRSFKALFDRSAGQGQAAFELVQVGGPDVPEWLELKMRRVNQ